MTTGRTVSTPRPGSFCLLGKHQGRACGHPIRNSRGVVIFVAQGFINTLRMRNLLRPGKVHGHLMVNPVLSVLINEENRIHFHELYRYLGSDESGPSVPLCNCRKCGRDRHITGFTDFGRLLPRNWKRAAAAKAPRKKTGRIQRDSDRSARLVR